MDDSSAYRGKSKGVEANGYVECANRYSFLNNIPNLITNYLLFVIYIILMTK